MIKMVFLKFFGVVMMFLILSSLWMVWKFRFKFYYERETSSPFECGFDKKDAGRMPFSLRFFSMLVMFLMFDIELMLLLHLVIKYQDLMFSYWGKLLMYLFLMAGLYEEWRRNLLKWKNI